MGKIKKVKKVKKIKTGAREAATPAHLAEESAATDGDDDDEDGGWGDDEDWDQNWDDNDDDAPADATSKEDGKGGDDEEEDGSTNTEDEGKKKVKKIKKVKKVKKVKTDKPDKKAAKSDGDKKPAKAAPAKTSATADVAGVVTKLLPLVWILVEKGVAVLKNKDPKGKIHKYNKKHIKKMGLKYDNKRMGYVFVGDASARKTLAKNMREFGYEATFEDAPAEPVKPVKAAKPAAPKGAKGAAPAVAKPAKIKLADSKVYKVMLGAVGDALTLTAAKTKASTSVMQNCLAFAIQQGRLTFG